MNKKLFYSAALALLLFAGASSVKAQEIQTPPMKPEIEAMAQQILDTQLEDPDGANKVFAKLLRKVARDKEQSAATAKFFLDKKIYPCAKQLSDKAYELDPQNVNVLMLGAEVAMMRRDFGMAGQKYDEIVAQDPSNVAALKRRAFIYKNINPEIAKEDLKKIKEVEPNNPMTDKELGDIYYRENNFKEAVAAYGVYYAATPKTKEAMDIRAGENYIQSLFFLGQYDQALKILDEVQPLDPEVLVFHRMRFLNNYESYNATSLPATLKKAEEAVAYIASNKYDSLYIYLDYEYAAKLYNELEKYSEAIKYIRAGIALDATKVQAHKALANYLSKNKDHEAAVEAYEKYLELLGEGAKNADLLGMMRIARNAARAAEAEKRNALLAKGNAAIDKIEAHNPGSYSVSRYRAQLFNMDNNPNDVVKKYYEEVLSRAQGKDDADDARVEAYSYLAFYAVKKDLYDEARKNVDMVLKLDAEDGTAKQIDAFLKSIGK